ncbi:MAG: gliding motility-associated ABC transporter substrate-binding protein GldG [Bacteroidales bacterium]
MDKKKKVKRQNISELILLLLLVALINLVGSFLFHRFDLTREMRYTVSEGTRNTLRDLNDVVYVKVYLDGPNLPAGFRRLRKAVKETLDEFRAYAKSNIEYEFIDPSESPDAKTRREIYEELAKDGLQYFNVQSQDRTGAATTQVVFPAAVLSYRQHGQDYERVVNFFTGSISNMFNDATINRSIEMLEYEFITGIRTVSRENTPKVAIIEGHGELDRYKINSLVMALANFYTVERVAINEQLAALDSYQAIIIADPTERIGEKDKFIIDQYLMRGGRVLWMVDAVKVDMNHIAFEKETMGEINSVINIGDMLYSYGVRINSSLVQDYQCAIIPVNVAPVESDKPDFQPAPFVFFPIVSGLNNHPVSRNINPVKLEFASPIDTVGEDPRVRKTILLATSDNSRVVRPPIIVSTSLFAEKPDPSRFPLRNLPVAVLLEGEFTSHFRHRLPPSFVNNEAFKVYEESGSPGRMIVVSDGDVAKNYVQMRDEQYFTSPLGFDNYTRTTFGNRDFLLNCVNYLLDDEGYMDVRSREVKVRLLDEARILSQRGFWKLFNLVLPVILVLLFGITYIVLRKRKYAR